MVQSLGFTMFAAPGRWVQLVFQEVRCSKPLAPVKKKRKKKFEFILQALLKDNKNVRKGPSETKEGNLLHVFALCSCSSSLNKALP